MHFAAVRNVSFFCYHFYYAARFVAWRCPNSKNLMSPPCLYLFTYLLRQLAAVYTENAEYA